MPPGPAGLARVEVKFLIDANGILQVTAKDVRTNEQNTIEIQPSYGLNDAEVERMLEESIEYAEKDFTERQIIEARNEAESVLFATNKALSQQDLANADAAETRAVNAAIAALQSAAAGSDYKLIRAKIDELNQSTMPLAERMMNRAVATALEGKRVADV